MEELKTVMKGRAILNKITKKTLNDQTLEEKEIAFCTDLDTLIVKFYNGELDIKKQT